MWPGYGVCSIPYLCTLSAASAIIEPSLPQLDFFLEIFLWRLVGAYSWGVICGTPLNNKLIQALYHL